MPKEYDFPPFRFVANCTDSCHGPNGEAIHEMQSASEAISYKELEELVGREGLKAAFPDYDWRSKPKDLTLEKDWSVSYSRSVWREIPCVFVEHSRIEYIFTEEGRLPPEWDYHPPLDDDEDEPEAPSMR